MIIVHSTRTCRIKLNTLRICKGQRPNKKVVLLAECPAKDQRIDWNPNRKVLLSWQAWFRYKHNFIIWASPPKLTFIFCNEGGWVGVWDGEHGTNFAPSRTVDKSDTEPDKMCSLVSTLVELLRTLKKNDFYYRRAVNNIYNSLPTLCICYEIIKNPHFIKPYRNTVHL